MNELVADGVATLVVVVSFKVAAEHLHAFRDAVLENARVSLESEKGCHVFDVCEDSGKSEFFLFEIYRDEPAFDSHLASAHFRAFNRKVEKWVKEKTVRQYRKLAAVKTDERWWNLEC